MCQYPHTILKIRESLHMILLNFAHPLTAAQRASVERCSGQALERIIEVKTQLDHDQPFAAQVRQLVEAMGLSSEEWQTLPLVVNLPSLSVIAVLVVTELHGHCGYFPAVLRLKPVPDTTPLQFTVAEIVTLQMVRDAARHTR
jgi:hypothetical protein